VTFTDTTIANIRAELVTGIERNNRRRQRSGRLVAAAAVLLAVLVAGAVLAVGEQRPAYAVSREPDGTLRVEVFPDFDEVDELQASLAEVGLDATVVHLRGHPSLDGFVEVASHNNERNGAFLFDDGMFEIDVANAESPIEILIYTAAEEGQTYQFAPSIFALGQPLEGLPCAYSDAPLTTTELERRAATVGLSDILWTYFENPAPGATGSEDLTEAPNGVVVSAQLHDVDTLRVIAVPNVDEPAAETLVMSDGTHYQPASVCTPELAALWD